MAIETKDVVVPRKHRFARFSYLLRVVGCLCTPQPIGLRLFVPSNKYHFCPFVR